MSLSNRYPLKFGVLFILAKEKVEMNVEEVYNKLEPVFGGEKAFNKENVKFHLDSMVGIGMLNMTNEYFDSNGELAAYFAITPFGMKRTELLPDEYRAALGN